MATSGSINFELTRNEIITAALRKICVLGKKQQLAADDLNMCVTELNCMLLEWQGEGIYVWTQNEGILFTAKDTKDYTLSSTGDHSCMLSDLVTTTTTVSAAAAATALTVTSTTGMAVSDKIGIYLDDGSRQWTTISAIGSSTTLTLAAGLSSAAGVGATVYTYTTKLNRPVKVTDVRYKDDNNQERMVEVIDRSWYQNIVSKTTSGFPVQIYYNAGRSVTGTANIWPVPATAAGYLIFNYVRDIEDFDNATDTPDFPREWRKAIIYNLAMQVAPNFRVDIKDFPDVLRDAETSYRKVKAMSYELEDIQFCMDKY